MGLVRRIGFVVLGMSVLLALAMQLSSAATIVNAFQDEDDNVVPAAITTTVAEPPTSTTPPDPTATSPADPTATSPADPTATPAAPTSPADATATSPADPTSPADATATPSGPTATPAPPSDDDDDDDDGADPRLAKSVNTTQPRLGDTLVYELVVTVDGDRSAEDVIVEDNIPAFYTLLNVTTDQGTVNVNGANVQVVVGTVSPDQEVRIRIAVQVTSIPEAREYANVAVLTTTTDTDRPENNTATTTVTFTEPPTEGDAATPTPVVTGEVPSPTAEVAPTVPPTEVPTATPPQPVALPNTGTTDGGTALLLPVLLLLAIGVMGLGFRLSRRRVR